MRVSENIKRRRISGINNAQLVNMGQRIRKLKAREKERFVMDGITSSEQRHLWRERLQNHVREFDVRVSIRWFQHIMVVERL
jgi:hypothetical protein